MRVGDLIDGRFELVAPAGSGGMGTVYRALDTATGSTVALKVGGLHLPAIADPERREPASELASLLGATGVGLFGVA